MIVPSFNKYIMQNILCFDFIIVINTNNKCYINNFNCFKFNAYSLFELRNTIFQIVITTSIAALGNVFVMARISSRSASFNSSRVSFTNSRTIGSWSKTLTESKHKSCFQSQFRTTVQKYFCCIYAIKCNLP